MKIKIVKNLNEKLDYNLEKKFDQLEQKKDDGKLSTKEKAIYNTLSTWDSESDTYTLDDYNQTFGETNKNSTNKKINRTKSSKIDPDKFDKASQRFGDNKNDLQFFRDLSDLQEEDKAFYHAISKCLNEMTPNALYWVCYDFQNASKPNKQKVINQALNDVDTIQGYENSGFSNTRALMLRPNYVDKFLRMYKRYAGTREMPGQKKPVKMPKKDTEKNNNPDNEKDTQNDNVKSEDSTLYVYKGQDTPKNVSSFEKIRIMEGTSIIREEAFLNMKKVFSVVWYAQSNKKVGFDAGKPRRFVDSLPNTVQIIKKSAFQGCSSLQKLELSDNLQQIDSNAFNGTKINNFYLGKSMKNVSRDAFSGVNAKNIEIKINIESPFYKSVKEDKTISSFQQYFRNSNLTITFVGKEKKNRITNAIKRITGNR